MLEFAQHGEKRTSRRVNPAQEIQSMAHEACDGLISEVAQPLECDLEAVKGLELLDTAGITSAPVVDDNGVLVGIVFLATLAQMREVAELEVEDAMITDVICVSRGTSVADIARLMAQHHLERVPVTTEDGHLVGVVSAIDVVCWLAARL